MLKKCILLLLFATPSFLLAQSPKKSHLDGKKFTTSVTEDGKKKPLDPDELSFTMGKFKSALFADWGFVKATKYEVTNIDSTSTPDVTTYSWTVDMVNDQDEKLGWSGTVTGDEVEGTIELVNKKGVVKKTYTFTGTLKKKPGKK